VYVKDITVIGILERLDAEDHEGGNCIREWITEEQR
jgi:hypothetical protein